MLSEEKQQSGAQALLKEPRPINMVMIDMKLAELHDDSNLKSKGLIHFSQNATFYFCLIIVLILTIICTSSLFLLDDNGSIPTHHFRGRCNIPVAMPQGLKQNQASLKNSNIELESFYETFDIGLQDNPYANIDVPSFQDGKPGRFIHDFSTNMTAIVDPEGMRCFVMPLDRSAVLPPNSLMDMIQKMMDGYYNINMNVIKHDMRVITPPIKDLSRIGVHINKECGGYEVYALENYYHSVSKRSINEAVPVKFREFAGNTFQEFDILNLQEIIKYEAETKQVVPN